MANLRKIIATDVIHGLLRHSFIEETSADRVGGLAFSDALGSLLWRLRWANDHRAFEPAALLLAKRCRGRSHQSPGWARSICRIALEEWLDDVCRKCGGRGHTINQGVKHACPGCSATGTRRHSDVQRMRLLKLDRKRYAKAEVTFADAHAKLADADSRCWRDLAIQLERITGKAGVRERVLAMSLPRGIMEIGAGPAHTNNTMPESPAAAHSAHTNNAMPSCRESR